MKRCRQLHLWIGLFTSILILVEAVTGLLMIEPWLIGVNKPSAGQQMQFEKTGENFGRETQEYGKPADGTALQEGDVRSANKENNLMRFIKNLHSGKINNTDVSILLDIAAVGLIILSITGIILSIRTLRAHFR